MRYDVVIYDMATRRIEAVVGRDLPRDRYRLNAQRRWETAMNRINLDTHSAEIVPCAVYNAGDVLPEEDCR